MVRRRQQVVDNRILSNTSEKRKRRGSRFKDRLRVRPLAEGKGVQTADSKEGEDLLDGQEMRCSRRLFGWVTVRRG